MKLIPITYFIGTLLSSTTLASTKHSSLQSRNLHPRNPTGNFNSVYSATNYQNGSTAPGASSADASGQTVVVGGIGDNDDSQRPGCSTIFINTATVGGSQDSGWTSTPQLVGFNIDRNITYNGDQTMPMYIESGKDYTKIKRVLITQPGLPRDSWKYVNLFRNSLICAVGNDSMPVTLDDVLISAPIWLGSSDVAAGAGQSSDIYFGDSSWSTGAKSQGAGKGISTFTVMDDIVSRFANQTLFPALTSILVVGHSLGGSFSQRYAMARTYEASTDPLVSYWVGNPGSYVWPSATRIITPSNTSCASTVDDWTYGVGGDLPSYFTITDPTAIYNRYFARTIQYALGLADNGPGDTHCEAQYQGSSHLNRGQTVQQTLEALPGGIPPSQSFNYVPNTSHEDYLMMSDPNSQEYLFVTNLTNSRPAGTTTSATSSSSGGSSTSSSKKKGGSSTSSSSSDSTSGSVALSWDFYQNVWTLFTILSIIASLTLL